jgi:2-hydroxy-3-keto-5-methylthiopentenyl-1-phosphate phosphatase
LSNQTELYFEQSSQLNLSDFEHTLVSLRDHDLNLLHQFQSGQLMQLIEEVHTKDVGCGENVTVSATSSHFSNNERRLEVTETSNMSINTKP